MESIGPATHGHWLVEHSVRPRDAATDTKLRVYVVAKKLDGVEPAAGVHNFIRFKPPAVTRRAPLRFVTRQPSQLSPSAVSRAVQARAH
jgi:hypothetical protein